MYRRAWHLLTVCTFAGLAIVIGSKISECATAPTTERAERFLTDYFEQPDYGRAKRVWELGPQSVVAAANLLDDEQWAQTAHGLLLCWRGDQANARRDAARFAGALQRGESLRIAHDWQLSFVERPPRRGLSGYCLGHPDLELERTAAEPSAPWER